MARIVRPIRIEGNLAYVPLTRGYESIIDALDVPMVYGFNWYALIGKWTVYACSRLPKDADGKRKVILMHRIIMYAPDNILSDHKNGNGLDNRRSRNLRLATNSQNSHNKRIGLNNVSGIKGVSWDKRSQKWRAVIKINSKSKHLGYFNKISDAAARYATASTEYHGEFGRTS